MSPAIVLSWAMQSCWDILGIEETTDKLAIKRAYSKLAHVISPEDDPEGFRKIHSAYKLALDFASGKDISVNTSSEEENLSGTDVSQNTTESHTESGAEDAFDFSSVSAGDEKFSDEIEDILDTIVVLKKTYVLTSTDNVERWSRQTQSALSMRMFELYIMLYERTGDVSIWNSFFDEPLIKYFIYDRKFRELLRSQFPEESEAGRIIAGHCDKQDAAVAAEEEASQAKLVEENKNKKRKALWHGLSIATFIVFIFAGIILLGFTYDAVVIFGTEFLLFEFLIFCICNWYIASNWGKEVTEGAVSSLFTRNVIVIFGCILYLFILILTMVGKDWATIGIRSIPAALAIAGVIAMCIQHKILSK